MTADRLSIAVQRGSALLVVLVLTVVACFTALAVSRLMSLNESSVGLAADQARAFAAATALLRDAETDVAGAWPDGSSCAGAGSGIAAGASGMAGCLPRASGVFFPTVAGQMDSLRDILGTEPVFPCRDGICLPLKTVPTDAADIKKYFAELTDSKPATFATYGRFTGATVEAGGTAQNPYLAGHARCWVEVLDYAEATGIAEGGSRHQPDATRPYVFRITAAVEGRRPETQVVLRELFVPTPALPPP